ELFHTERVHLRHLKVMKMLYERPMRNDPNILPALVGLIFPNLDELIGVHENINREFQKCREQQKLVTKVGDVILSQFSGVRGDHLKKACSIFCRDQAHALLVLKKKQKKEKLMQIFQEASLSPYSGRLGLKEFLPKEMQRITKYPLLIDNLINNSSPLSDDHSKLIEANRLTKSILRYVDGQMRECENKRHLDELQSRLDTRLIENSTDPNMEPYKKLDLTKKKLILDGELVVKAGGQKSHDMHCILCEDVLLLLIKQEDRLVFKCQTTTIEDRKFTYYPVLKLSGLLTKNAGKDKYAFYIIDSNSPQFYHMVAKTKELRNKSVLRSVYLSNFLTISDHYSYFLLLYYNYLKLFDCFDLVGWFN
ncbi:hypothetical protein HELRODRAFT_75172, partial [Helobdella robusta]|uniref:DH domain-containing protein n=1 Tax=Helobdella robusta TaxID=6412 RepID=T1G221_HELRO